jgi:hypothetical protein
MSWDDPSPTITAGCTTLSKGRFGHPEQLRTTSLREAALLQTFPDDYHFETDVFERACEIVGNALPCDFAAAIAGKVREAIITVGKASAERCNERTYHLVWRIWLHRWRPHERRTTPFYAGIDDNPRRWVRSAFAHLFPELWRRRVQIFHDLAADLTSAGLLRLAECLSDYYDRIFAYNIDKRFSLLIKFIDYLVEPLIYANGYDFYKDGYRRRYANMVNSDLLALDSGELHGEIIARWNRFARKPTRDELATLKKFVIQQRDEIQGPLSRFRGQRLT